MRRVWIGLLLAVVTPPACAQTAPKDLWCGGSDVSEEEQIAGCSARIRLGGAPDAPLAEVHNGRGSLHETQSRHDAAIANHTRAIALDADDARPDFNRGTVYAAKGSRE